MVYDLDNFKSFYYRSNLTEFIDGSIENELCYLERSWPRFIEAFELVRLYSPNSILDVGCSPFTVGLLYFFPDLKVVGLDKTKHLSSVLESYGIELYDDIRSINQVFDLVFILEVIEHVQMNPVIWLGEFKRVMSRNSILYLTTPNQNTLGNRFKVVRNRPMDQYDYPAWTNSSIEHGLGHDRIFNGRELEDYCRRAGYNYVKLDYSLALDKNRLASGGKRWWTFIFNLVIPDTRNTITLTLKL